MKTLLREAGVPCARHSLAATRPRRLPSPKRSVPIVVKPPAGAGLCPPSRRWRWGARRGAARERARRGQPAILEEFITGEEHSFETMSLDGHAVWQLAHALLPDARSK